MEYQILILKFNFSFWGLKGGGEFPHSQAVNDQNQMGSWNKAATGFRLDCEDEISWRTDGKLNRGEEWGERKQNVHTFWYLGWKWNHQKTSEEIKR